eukprot:CAMPEP_0197857072 /NCGR_PEP_ID=MMETSP1438-20131217/29815_1 /TAXON_ID=1461541 /ORGANISM="Pterosperma sp., Strain CCMP1384" /LENGTH=750 /DNA_ID=CAMNT_0043472767 /DNA_START=353 /DNA_END=2605 /DNA_ORIENTATION=-
MNSYRAVLCFAAVVLASTGCASAAELNFRSLTDYQDAVCMDGTDAGYYYKMGLANEATWIVILGGGPSDDGDSAVGSDWCWDVQTCSELFTGSNQNIYRSSQGWEDKIHVSGIFDSQHSYEELGFDLTSAHKIYVPYCSGDAWLGNQAPSSATGGLAFQGTKIVHAVIEDLVQHHNLGAAIQGEITHPIQNGDKWHTLVFGGVGAGARGAMAHLDYLDQMIPLDRVERTLAVGFFDSGLWLDLPPLKSSNYIGMAKATRSAYSMMNMQHTGELCSAHYHSEGNDDLWMCMFPEYRLPFIKVPFFLVQDQYDRHQIQLNTGLNCPTESEAADQFSDILFKRYVSYLHELAIDCATKNCAYWSSSCYTSSSTLTNRGYEGIKVFDDIHQGMNTYSVADAFEGFLNELVMLVEGSYKYKSYEFMNHCLPENSFACSDTCDQDQELDQCALIAHPLPPPAVEDKPTQALEQEVEHILETAAETEAGGVKQAVKAAERHAVQQDVSYEKVGGSNGACRTADGGDGAGGCYDLVPVDDSQECASKCTNSDDCKGYEFLTDLDNDSARCELWTCVPENTGDHDTAQCYVKKLSEPVFSMVGEKAGACRTDGGANPDECYEVTSAEDIDTCAISCKDRDDCKGYEYLPSKTADARCEIWTCAPTETAEHAVAQCFVKQSAKSEGERHTSQTALLALVAFGVVFAGYYFTRVRGRLSDQVKNTYSQHRSYQRADEEDAEIGPTIQMGDVKISTGKPSKF